MLIFMDEQVPRFYGAWPHWFNGSTGDLVAFGSQDGGDLVETSFMIQGMLTARQYFDLDNPVESEIRSRADSMWRSVDWHWFLRRSDAGYETSETLHWLWSPTSGFDTPDQIAIHGFNECMITYLLAIASPTHPIPASCYYNGWASVYYENNNSYYGYWKWVGSESEPLFFNHYSFLGFDPRGKTDGYCNYFYNSRNDALIDRAYCIENPKGFVGYSDLVWGLSACYNPWGYGFQSPGYEDNGTVATTAAISSMPYTPQESIASLKHFYHTYGAEGLWGPFGFVDAFNLNEHWYASGYVAIDQGPIIVMIENYRSRLCWDMFMANSEIQPALDAIGWTILDGENFVLASYETDETDLTVSSSDAGILTLQSVVGGINGAPVAVDGNNVLKIVWSGETDRKIEIRHQWSALTFDLADYDEIRADVYIASASALPNVMGIWDDVFDWHPAACCPNSVGQWFTVSFDISGRDEVCLDHICAFIFENLAGDDGTVYIDNLRLVGAHVINFTVPYSERQQSNYSGAACLKMALDYECPNAYTQTVLHSYGVANNSAENQGSSYIDPRGMFLSMNHYESEPNYNYSALSATTLNTAYHNICYWIEYSIVGADPEHLPAMIPVGGDYSSWVIVNGFSASDNPWTAANYTVNGFWLTDPAASGIGENIYKTASDLGNSYITVSTSDVWDGKYVSVCEPPAQQANVSISRPAKYKDKLSSKQDIIAAAVKGLEDNVLGIDGELEVAYIGSRPCSPVRVYSKSGDYFIVPFMKNDGCSVAVIVDAADGTFREASYCSKPDVKYMQRFKKTVKQSKRADRKLLKHRNAFLPSSGSAERLSD